MIFMSKNASKLCIDRGWQVLFRNLLLVISGLIDFENYIKYKNSKKSSDFLFQNIAINVYLGVNKQSCQLII